MLLIQRLRSGIGNATAQRLQLSWVGTSSSTNHNASAMTQPWRTAVAAYHHLNRNGNNHSTAQVMTTNQNASVSMLPTLRPRHGHLLAIVRLKHLLTELSSHQSSPSLLLITQTPSVNAQVFPTAHAVLTQQTFKSQLLNAQTIRDNNLANAQALILSNHHATALT